MPKIVIDEIASGYSLSKINDQFNKIETYINDKVLSRDSDGNSNAMTEPLDMDSNPLLNLPAPNSPTSPVRVTDVPNLVAQSQGANYVGETAPPAPFNGMRWFNPSIPTTFVWYQDTDSGQWVEETAQGVDGKLRQDFAYIEKLLDKKLAFTDLGGVADGVTDNRAAYVTAINRAVSEGFTLVFTKGIYGFSDWIPLASNLRMVFEEGAELKLLATTGPIGGFVIGGASYPSFTPIPLDNCVIVNPTIDCNNLVGENGISSIAANGLFIYNPTIKNCLRSDVALGGRAFQFEGGIIKDVYIYNPVIKDCSIGINSQGDPSGTYVAENINYYDVAMFNVDVPFNIDSGFASPETNTPATMSTNVYGASLRNCGRLKYPGVTDAVGGGIICGDRGYGLFITDVNIVNEAAYGGIGAICRGTMFGVRVRNLRFFSLSSMTAIFDHRPLSFGAPSGASHPSWVDADDIHVICNLDYIIETKSGGGALGDSIMRRITVDSSVATVAAICGPNASSYADAYLDVVDRNNPSVGKNKGTGLQALTEFAAAGNLLNASTLGRYDLRQLSGVWSPSYTGTTGAPASVTMANALPRWTRVGNLVTVTSYIATNNLNVSGMTGAVVISGLPFIAAGYAVSAVAIASGFVTHPISALVVVGENQIRLYKRSSTTSADSPLLAGDLTNGASAGANAIAVSVTYEVQ